jgi:hypothetical protein
VGASYLRVSTMFRANKLFTTIRRYNDTLRRSDLEITNCKNFLEENIDHTFPSRHISTNILKDPKREENPMKE